jgi:HopA1 effector protein family
VIGSSHKHSLPNDIDRALVRLLQTLRSAPGEIKEFGIRSDEHDREEIRASTLDRLARWLYATWYCALEPAEAAHPSSIDRENLAAALRASVSASTRWESGWVAVQVGLNGVCLAGRGTQTRELRPGEYVNLARQGLPVAPGDSVVVTELVEWTDQSTGFWCARSWVAEPRDPLVRLYFSVACDHVGYVLAELTATLDALKIPYSLKCPSLAAAYSRVDSVVMYLQADAWPHTASAIRAASRQVATHLRRVTPPLTKKIFPGVAFAEDPGNKQSFGESRCAALAPGALTLLADERFTTSSGIFALTESLRAAGIDPARPWLNVACHA